MLEARSRFRAEHVRLSSVVDELSSIGTITAAWRWGNPGGRSNNPAIGPGCGEGYYSTGGHPPISRQRLTMVQNRSAVFSVS